MKQKSTTIGNLNQTSIKFYSCTIDEGGNQVKTLVKEIANKEVRGKHRERVRRIRELIRGIDDMNEAANVIVENGQAVSKAEARRLFTQLKEN